MHPFDPRCPAVNRPLQEPRWHSGTEWLEMVVPGAITLLTIALAFLYFLAYKGFLPNRRSEFV